MSLKSYKVPNGPCRHIRKAPGVTNEDTDYAKNPIQRLTKIIKILRKEKEEKFTFGSVQKDVKQIRMDEKMPFQQ